MSNSQVIAATTATLRLLLSNGIPLRDAAIPNLDVTTLPPDRVGADLTRPALNLFLYQTAVNGAWRNRDAAHARPGESPLPPLALNLHYLLTSYGQVDVQDGDFSQRVLGAAVSVLHDHPVLGTDAVVSALPNHPALRQVERMRIAPLGMTIEELSKLWTIFQTNYRLSAAYEVSVVLIESDRAATMPLPVLRRGGDDRGPVALATASATLRRAVPPRGQPAVRLGETLRLEGSHLATGGLRVRISSPLLAAPVMLDPLPGGTAEEIAITLPAAAAPNVMAAWAPGFYRAEIVVPHPGIHDQVSNAVPFALAPTITVAPPAPPAGPVTLTIAASPRLRATQEALLLFGARRVAEKQRTQPANVTQPTTCDFDVSGAANESYVVRLRVDGVDSIPTDPADPSTFDPQQTVAFQ